jgi:DNA-nicking Smr family endonuclease
MSNRIYHLDLHPIAKDSRKIDTALAEALEAVQKKRLATLEIIPGKGTGQLMKRVKKWLQEPQVKNTYFRVEVDDKNHGRVFVHFRHDR